MKASLIARDAGRVLAVGTALLLAASAGAQEYQETPSLQPLVESGALPAVVQRVPKHPRVVDDREVGRHGGELRLIMSRARDTRLMTVYGYARLVGYNTSFEIVPDILEDVRVEDERVFTFKIREGHRWSDGEPFSAEDFPPIGPPTIIRP